jgi:hypothetical protein
MIGMFCNKVSYQTLTGFCNERCYYVLNNWGAVNILARPTNNQGYKNFLQSFRLRLEIYYWGLLNYQGG